MVHKYQYHRKPTISNVIKFRASVPISRNNAAKYDFIK